MLCFFDSGMGGLSVLGEVIRLLPQAEYIYFADVKNCPLGQKSPDQIVEVLHNALDFFASFGTIEGVVIACNTATGYGIGRLRDDLPTIPFFGMEPAVKPASECVREGSILVLTTEATAKQQRFQCLVERHNARDNIFVCPQSNLAGVIEQNFPQNMGAIEDEVLRGLLPYKGENVGGVVLGCTHYIYAKDLIQKIFPKAKIFEGNAGAARHIAAVMEKRGYKKGVGKIFTSAENIEIEKKYMEILKSMIQ